MKKHLKTVGSVLLISIASVALMFWLLFSGDGNGIGEYYRSPEVKAVRANKFINTNEAEYVCILYGVGYEPKILSPETEKIAELITKHDLAGSLFELEWKVVSFNANKVVDSVTLSAKIDHVLNKPNLTRVSINGNDRLDCVPAATAFFDKFGSNKSIGLVSK